MRWLHSKKSEKLLLQSDVDFLIRHKYIVEDFKLIETEPGVLDHMPLGNGKFRITDAGVDYLHQIEEVNWSSLRSWIALVISMILLALKFIG
ncbi:hypothetical protein H9L19_06665 [Weissella diestrammenae]|uniref:Uncharacterized protein n=1 Tax=Weissella diestrammenae TaxID=1162633 RepID=A0A7G9T4N1_9LACO|nr:hypothetical protein [Weissella diestrammenae]QNN75056.1 hypothetical protein H9L19_06665 [Weissella diestrammenae]